jgi:pilus assembly protein Flp/PilA
MRELWNNFVKDESGQGLVEYVLIIALVSVAVIALIFTFGGHIAEFFAGANEQLEDTGPGCYSGTTWVTGGTVVNGVCS